MSRKGELVVEPLRTVIPTSRFEPPANNDKQDVEPIYIDQEHLQIIHGVFKVGQFSILLAPSY